MARVAAVNEKVPYEVLMLGAAGSGKTLLVRRIKALCHLRVPEDAADTMQTNGVELDEIEFNRSVLKMREVGGAFVEVWNRYYQDCNAWVFVIDVTDRIALVEATAELITTASHPEMRNKPLWLVFNKIDLPGAIPQHELALLMRLADLQHTMGSWMQPTSKGIPLFIPLTRRMQVRHVSALEGTGVMDLMKVLTAFPRNARPLS